MGVSMSGDMEKVHKIIGHVVGGGKYVKYHRRWTAIGDGVVKGGIERRASLDDF
jgi:hypothetical protein